MRFFSFYSHLSPESPYEYTIKLLLTYGGQSDKKGCLVRLPPGGSRRISRRIRAVLVAAKNEWSVNGRGSRGNVPNSCSRSVGHGRRGATTPRGWGTPRERTRVSRSRACGARAGVGRGRAREVYSEYGAVRVRGKKQGHCSSTQPRNLVT